MGFLSIAYRLFFVLLAVVFMKQLVEPIMVPRQMLLTAFLAITSLSIFLGIRKKKLSTDIAFLKQPLIITAAIIAVLTLVSIIQAIAPFETAYTLSRVLIFLLFLVSTTYLLLAGQIDHEDLFKGVTVFLLLAQLMGLFQLSKGFSQVSEISATFGNKNLYASSMVFCLPFVVSAMRGKQLWRMLSILATLLTVFLVIFLEARAAMLALAVFGSVYFLGILTKLRAFDRSPKLTRTIAAVAGVAVLAFGILVISSPQSVADYTDTKTINERLVLWNNSMDMIADHPILGVGAGNWKLHNPAYGLADFDARAKTGLEIFQRPHNDFLWAFSELGILGFLGSIAFFFFAIRTALKLINRKEERSLVHLAMLAGLLAYLANSLLDFPSERVEHQVLLMSLLAILMADSSSMNPKTKQASLLLKGSGFLAVAAIIFSALVVSDRYTGEFYTARLYAAKSQAQWRGVMIEADQAINTYYKLDASSTPILWYKGLGYFAQGQAKEALSTFNEALKVAPNDIHVLTNIAACHATLGDKDRAIEFFERCLVIAPDYSKPRLNLAMIHQERGEYAKAYDAITPLPYMYKDKNYMNILPGVLKNHTDLVMAGMSDKAKAQRIGARINTPQKMVDEFAASKKQGVAFLDHLKAL